MDNGTITQTERKAIMNINGHSSRTTEDYYLLKDRCNDAKNGAVMFNALLNDVNISIPSDTETDFDKALQRTPPQRLLGDSHQLSPWNLSISASKPWGTMHPSPLTSETVAAPRRVQWSPDELEYIARWVKQNEGDNRDNKVSRCLAKIRSDPTARGMCKFPCY